MQTKLSFASLSPLGVSEPLAARRGSTEHSLEEVDLSSADLLGGRCLLWVVDQEVIIGPTSSKRLSAWSPTGPISSASASQNRGPNAGLTAG